MARTKIDYGIDLGTTNSAIARMENGKPKIIRIDGNKDIMPSCVGFNKKKFIQVGYPAYANLKSDKERAAKTGENQSNVFIEFKRTMGTDKTYFSSFMENEYSSEQLSAEVLKKLRSYVTDENFQSVIITVPARFDIPQMDATKRAAKLAGFDYCELLSEPIAASMAYGLNNKNKNGYWIVFDFGGGTFDAALIKVEDGIMKVVDTDGDNYLGGKTLDEAIVDKIIFPYLMDNYETEPFSQSDTTDKLLHEYMRLYAEKEKIQLSFEKEVNMLSNLGELPEDEAGEEMVLDIDINKEKLREVISPIFQRAIDITKELINRNNLSGDKLDALILVGGPTHSPILREMLEDQIKKPDTSADPMTAVATGAALYSSTVDLSEEIIESGREVGKIQLDVGYRAITVEHEAWITVKTLPKKTEGVIPDKVFAELEKNDKTIKWSSGTIEINAKGEILEVKLEEGANTFNIILYNEKGNRLEAQPDNFTIICGISDGGGGAILNHSIGIEVDTGKPYSVFEPVKGLEKNVSIPATGTINGLKTKVDIRPGNSQDKIRIGLYQGEEKAIGSRAIYNKPIYDVIITGDDLPSLLPENSDVDLTIITDKSSGRIEKLEAYFPYLDYTHEVPIPENPPTSITQERLSQELKSAEATIQRLKSNSLIDQSKLSEIEKEFAYQRERFDQGGTEIDRRIEVFGNLNKALRQADELESDIEWQSMEKELREKYESLEKANTEFGNEKTIRHVQEIKSQVDEVVRKQDVESGQNVLEEIIELIVGLTFIYQLMRFVRYNNDNFASVKWKDPSRARQLINQAEGIIANNPSVNELHPVVIQIADLITDERGQEIPPEILRKGRG